MSQQLSLSWRFLLYVVLFNSPYSFNNYIKWYYLLKFPSLEVFDWYELPLEPLLLLPVIQVGLIPITYGELMSNQICLDCQCEEPKPQEAEQTEPKPTSAIVASKNRNLMEKKIRS